MFILVYVYLFCAIIVTGHLAKAIKEGLEVDMVRLGVTLGFLCHVARAVHDLLYCEELGPVKVRVASRRPLASRLLTASFCLSGAPGKPWG
jgi:hypothetical protein